MEPWAQLQKKIEDRAFFTPALAPPLVFMTKLDFL
jgi:hypothetical protein